MVVIC